VRRILKMSREAIKLYFNKELFEKLKVVLTGIVKFKDEEIDIINKRIEESYTVYVSGYCLKDVYIISIGIEHFFDNVPVITIGFDNNHNACIREEFEVNLKKYSLEELSLINKFIHDQMYYYDYS
jgi:hypothetical protein